MKHVLAIIGGSGFYAIPGLRGLETLSIDTPYGLPSSVILRGQLGNATILFLARHGEHHQIAPHAINYRANVCALKMAGATHLLSLSAVGSMREAIRPSDVVVVSDFIDMTHIESILFLILELLRMWRWPIRSVLDLAKAVSQAAKLAGARVHSHGTYLCIEGPQFSTRAESYLYRSWNVDVIGMTAMPEARLAREAELPYSTVAFVTDYDCWNDAEAEVSVDVVVSTLKKNADLAPKIVTELIANIPSPETSFAFGALKNAIITNPNHRDSELTDRLAWLIGTNRPHSEGQVS